MDPHIATSDPWATDSVYRELLTASASTGRWPLWVFDDERVRAPVDPTRALAEVDACDAGQVLSERWPGGCPCCDERLDPFRDGFPGLLPRPAVDPDAALAHLAQVGDGTYLRVPQLVSVTRPADVPAVIGWMGSFNSWDDTVGMSAVLRSWEQRFGAMLFLMNHSTLELAVAAPPHTEDECLRVAAEHIAFCWDAFDTYTGQITTDTLREYARRLEGAQRWRFWWD